MGDVDVVIPEWARPFVDTRVDEKTTWDEPQPTGQTIRTLRIWYTRRPPACERHEEEVFSDEIVTFGRSEYAEILVVDTSLLDALILALIQEVHNRALEAARDGALELPAENVADAVMDVVEMAISRLGKLGGAAAGAAMGVANVLGDGVELIELTTLLARLNAMQREVEALRAMDGRVLRTWMEALIDLRIVERDRTYKREAWPCERVGPPEKTTEEIRPRDFDPWEHIFSDPFDFGQGPGGVPKAD